MSMKAVMESEFNRKMSKACILAKKGMESDLLRRPPTPITVEQALKGLDIETADRSKGTRSPRRRRAPLPEWSRWRKK